MSPDRLRVGTLNIRNLADRWEERQALLFAEFAALQPDAFGLQEVVYPLQQDRLIAAAGAARYAILRAWAGRPEYGNAILVKENLEPEPGSAADRLDLGLGRCAHTVELRAPGGHRIRLVNLHLHHVVDHDARREEQVRRLLAWLDERPGPDVVIVTGDFNAEPVEPAYDRMVAAGFRSAYREANGAEPDVTWPSGLQAPAMDTDGDPGCLDYVWLRGPVRAATARLCFDRPAVDDPTLYPSDHRGIVAELQVGG